MKHPTKAASTKVRTNFDAVTSLQGQPPAHDAFAFFGETPVPTRAMTSYQAIEDASLLRKESETPSRFARVAGIAAVAHRRLGCYPRRRERAVLRPRLFRRVRSRRARLRCRDFHRSRRRRGSGRQLRSDHAPRGDLHDRRRVPSHLLETRERGFLGPRHRSRAGCPALRHAASPVRVQPRAPGRGRARRTQPRGRHQGVHRHAGDGRHVRVRFRAHQQQRRERDHGNNVSLR